MERYVEKIKESLGWHSFWQFLIAFQLIGISVSLQKLVDVLEKIASKM